MTTVKVKAGQCSTPRSFWMMGIVAHPLRGPALIDYAMLLRAGRLPKSSLLHLIV